MKDYLNSIEKRNVVMIAALCGTVSDILKNWKSLDKEEHKNLKTALTFANKTLDGIYNKILDSDKEKVQRLASDMDVSMTAKAKEIYAVIDKEDALCIAAAIDEQYCQKCNGEGFRVCRWRNILSLWDIDCIGLNKNCQYSYKESPKIELPKKGAKHGKKK